MLLALCTSLLAKLARSQETPCARPHHSCQRICQGQPKFEDRRTVAMDHSVGALQTRVLLHPALFWRIHFWTTARTWCCTMPSSSWHLCSCLLAPVPAMCHSILDVLDQEREKRRRPCGIASSTRWQVALIPGLCIRLKSWGTAEAAVSARPRLDFQEQSHEVDDSQKAEHGWYLPSSVGLEIVRASFHALQLPLLFLCLARALSKCQTKLLETFPRQPCSKTSGPGQGKKNHAINFSFFRERGLGRSGPERGCRRTENERAARRKEELQNCGTGPSIERRCFFWDACVKMKASGDASSQLDVVLTSFPTSFYTFHTLFPIYWSSPL